MIGGDVLMAYSDFVALFALETKRSPEELLAERPLKFPLGTNERGEALLDTLRTSVRLSLSGKRALDVGCAYGGLSIALAKAGASVVGIEGNAKLLSFAEANAHGIRGVELKLLDLANISLRDKFGPRSFDVIFLNDILEKYYEPDTIISNVDYLLSDAGLVYFKTVNSNSLRFIHSDGRNKAFGLALVDPDYWVHFGAKKPSIYYRSLFTTLGQFAFYGIGKRILIDEEKVLSRLSERHMSRRIREIFATAREKEFPDPGIGQILRRQTVRLRDRYIYDVRSRGDDYVKFKYGSSFFFVLAGRSDSVLAPNQLTTDLPEFGSVIRREVAEVEATEA